MPLIFDADVENQERHSNRTAESNSPFSFSMFWAVREINSLTKILAEAVLPARIW
jgi:hypothetical protein